MQGQSHADRGNGSLIGYIGRPATLKGFSCYGQLILTFVKREGRPILTAAALLLGRGLNARLHHRRSQTRRAWYPAIQAIARRCGYKIPTFGLRQQTTPVATVGSISSLLMPPYPLSVPKSEETTHESASFDSRVEPYPGLHRNGFCCGKASSQQGWLREGPHDVGCRY